MMRKVGFLTALLSLGFGLSVLLPACRDQADAPAVTPQAGEEGAESEETAETGEAGETEGEGETEDAAGPTPVNLRTGLRFTLPAGWTEQRPETVMRHAQAVIPGAEGAGELSVLYFDAGQGAGVEENFKRWTEQLDPVPGSEPERHNFEQGDLQIAWIDVRGTVKAARTSDEPDPAIHRIFGAVVQGEGVLWLFRAGGPDATLAAQRQNFIELLQSIERE